MPMKIYFAAAIRGGREYATTYHALISYTETLAEVLTEHIGDRHLSAHGETSLNDTDIYSRDMEWVTASDAMIAEVTAPSLGVGYEIGRAVAAGTPVLCLFNSNSDGRLSAMISGNPEVKVESYGELAEAERAIREFMEQLMQCE